MRPPRLPLRLVIASGYAAGFAALSSGLTEIPPSVMSGGDVIWFGGPFVAFLLPTAALVTDWQLRGLCVKHPVDGASVAEVVTTYDAIMLRVTLFVMALHTAILLALLGLFSGRSWAAQVVR